MSEISIREVSLREMVEAMKHWKDDETFRWYQGSYPGPDGSIRPEDPMRVTMGQVRKELGLVVSEQSKG